MTFIILVNASYLQGKNINVGKRLVPVFGKYSANVVNF